MDTTQTFPRVKSLSIVIEWENAFLADQARPRAMMKRLAEQLAELTSERAATADVLLMYDPDAIQPNAFAAETQGINARTPDCVTCTPVAVPGGSYIDMKNRGAEACRGDVVIFLDSDVIPEPGWLSSLVQSFDDPSVDVVAGATYIEPTGFYASAVSLFWFFPQRDPADGLVEAEIVFGNNVAFRRDLFVETPFPEVNQYRGQCGELIKTMRANGRRVFVQRSARCAHPPPNGVGHFVRRAICEGYDNFMIAKRRRNNAVRPPLALSYWSLRSWIPRTWSKIVADRRTTKASPATTVLAVVLAGSYCSLMIAGQVMTRISPAFVRRHFAI